MFLASCFFTGDLFCFAGEVNGDNLKARFLVIIFRNTMWCSVCGLVGVSLQHLDSLSPSSNTLVGDSPTVWIKLFGVASILNYHHP